MDFEDKGLGGRPTLPSGEPVIARWFAVTLVVLVPVGLVIIVLAFLSISREELGAAARRPPGDTTVTHERGQAALAEVSVDEEFVGCVGGIRMVGDRGGVSTVQRALSATCQLTEGPSGQDVRAGLEALAASRGVVRVAVFELTGVDASTRIEDGVPVVELNAKFQFEDATRAAPALVHELVHLAGGWPAVGPVDADAELAAVQAQQQACNRLSFRNEPPRTCLDADELLAEPDPRRALVEAGYLD